MSSAMVVPTSNTSAGQGSVSLRTLATRALLGGLIVGIFSGSPLQVSGPAAGLFVIIADLLSKSRTAYLESHGDATEAARGLVAAMTLDEKLGCLDGDTPFWPGTVDMGQGGYNAHPFPAARVERREPAVDPR